MSDMLKAADEATISYACPRCHDRVTERSYGPCSSCREELKEVMYGTPKDVEAEAYEPKMNVTPNAVAQKEEW